MTTFPRFTAGGAGALTLVVIGLSGSTASRLEGQDTTLSATMLRVLAEAADVHRTGKPVFLVADYRFPHTVIGHFLTRKEAQRQRGDSGATFGVFGPFVTPADRMSASAPKVVSVRVTTRTAQGLRTTQLDPNVDALFLSMSAIEKFAIPYYAKIYGPEYSRRLRQQLLSIGLLPHRFSVGDSLGGQRLRIWDPKEPRP